jgi:light-regulated signal transduction histidine kinase (bacteriophytochrome)
MNLPEDAESLRKLVGELRDELVLAEEESLRHARELERSNEELQEFASVASHDLQQPLRKIRTMAERLKEKCFEDLDETGRDYLDRIIRAGESMQGLVRGLLSLSMVEKGERTVEEICLHEMVEDTVSLLEVMVAESRASVTLDNLPRIEADGWQMRQLSLTLIGNALRFRHDERSPEVHISGEAKDENEEEVCLIRVRDNGIGFEEKYLDRIFSPFERLHGKNEYEGFGIGLAICSRIVERHGGSILATSRPGEGAEFVVRLPKRQSSREEERKEEP